MDKLREIFDKINPISDGFDVLEDVEVEIAEEGCPEETASCDEEEDCGVESSGAL